MDNGTGKKKISRRIIEVKGIVQGVGFRPFVYRHAQGHGLRGWVLNTSAGVHIDVEGPDSDLTDFLADLVRQPPPLAKIEAMTVMAAEPVGHPVFAIRSSKKSGEYVFVAPDICTCADCRSELTDAGNRRYGYAFINCTNCGPRFSIIHDVPYDRTATSMRTFPLCEKCAGEYDDPGDRRFHAQPNACPTCGPRLTFLDGKTQQQAEGNPIDLAVQALREGQILAIKGLGGFHLACDATDEAAVAELRRRKHRYGKPLAIMMENLEQASLYCEISAAEEQLLVSPQRPVVIVKRRPEANIAPGISRGLPAIGVMLPYTPLHFLLLDGFKKPLVMTSGNISGEPLIKDNEEALTRLNRVTDSFLLHDREIVNRIDDSVVRVAAGRKTVIRRARGYAPAPVPLPGEMPEVLACGPEQKNTFCLTRGCHAFVSQHIGDLRNLSTLEYYERTIDFYKRIFRINPRIVAYDLHPSYLSTQYAQSLDNVEMVGVQHHHAHIAGCMLENGISGPVIGIACDGTGYGLDGNLWGGEFLLADYQSFTRLGHFTYVRMPGGEKAVKQPYRMAYGYLYSLYGEDAKGFEQYMSTIDDAERIMMKMQMDKRLNAPLTSSCGRLFDAVAALINTSRVAAYEGEAASRLEAMTDKNVHGCYDFALRDCILDPAPTLRDIYDDMVKGVPSFIIATKFHNTLINALQLVCQEISRISGVRKVCLSGGVFQNVYLLEGLIEKLTAGGLKVYWPQKIPANDGGIALGQVMIAYHNARR